MSKKVNLITFLILLFSVSFHLSAQIPESAITIGRENSDYLTIQEAIDDPLVLSDSVLYLADSIHTEQHIIIDKNISIIGKGYNSTTLNENGDETYNISNDRTREKTTSFHAGQ